MIIDTRMVADSLGLELIFRDEYVPKVGDYIEEMKSHISDVVNITGSYFYVAIIRGKNVLISGSLKDKWDYNLHSTTVITTYWKVPSTRTVLDHISLFELEGHLSNRCYCAYDVRIYHVQEVFRNRLYIAYGLGYGGRQSEYKIWLVRQ